MDELRSLASSIGWILAVMAGLAALEVWIPLRVRGRWGRAHLGPNLALTFLAFATNAALGVALVVALAAAQERGIGLFAALALPGWSSALAALLVLDLSFYVAHVAMHHVPAFWRFHRVHHSDPEVDVTTTIRQHPGESAIRYAFTAAFALPLGASPAEFALYRSAVAFAGLLEHANLRVPAWLDHALSLVVTWPTYHKVHHARDARFTNTNYGNLVSWWDRLFGTQTPARVGREVATGLDGLDAPEMQTFRGLLALPFRAAGSEAARTPLRAPRSA